MKVYLLALVVIFSGSISHSYAQMRIKRDSSKNDQVTTIRDGAEDTHPEDIARDFIADLADPDIALDIVLSKHVLVREADDELLDYLLASLAEIRLNLMSKRIRDIQFVPYNELARRDVSDIDTEGKRVSNMIFLRYGKRQLTALYMEDDKIASFTLVSKGTGQAHFVTY